MEYTNTTITWPYQFKKYDNPTLRIYKKRDYLTISIKTTCFPDGIQMKIIATHRNLYKQHYYLTQ